MGFINVLTYSQSGHVLFDSNENDQLKLTQQIEKALSERFGYSSKVVLL